jgi:hypothetical protein
MSIEAMTQALEADRLIRGYVNSLVSNKPDEAAGFTKRMVDYVFATPPAAPLQVSPADFVDMVLDKEDATGKPIFWAEWPNREKNNAA